MALLGSCDDDWYGDDCELPRCGQRGIVDLKTRKCVCKGNFLPPFCRSCRPEFWGENCELKRFSPVTEPDDYSAYTPIVLLVAFLLLMATLLALAAYKRWQRRTVIDSMPPPKYEQIVHDRPPTYAEATGVDKMDHSLA
ncbi:hypothetical protein QR680_003344 [Steinernema hermaphroditum]|uniref:Uncharacterized protein n=1 Tax=Steinernema hermaphroditum TaxID=289476 RepID=A0AA39H7A4_9BILA|nr:hypothetical protein QR680_003344 [Steinernema hermaphroditum]